MKLRVTLAVTAAFLAVLPAFSQSAFAPPTLRIPGQPDRKIEPASLLGAASRDVRLEDVEGDVIVYHGMPLLEVLEKGGLDLKTMAGERKSVASVVLATARDGYTVVFSAGRAARGPRQPEGVPGQRDVDGAAAREGRSRAIDRARGPGQVGLCARHDRAEEPGET